jgi:hypothetical protein
MAVYRNISLSFWTDTKVEDTFTPEDKYMYLYLLTNPHTNICGCYEISTKQMSRQTGYNIESVERILDRMEKMHGVVRYCKETHEMLIPNWGRYNWTTSEKLVKPITTAINAIKFKPFRDYVSLLFDHIDEIHTVSIPYAYPIDTNCIDTTVPVSVPVPVTVSIKPIRHKYGEYKNVLLLDDEVEKLKAEFPDWESRIERLSEYIESKGAKYKNHFATIKAWARKDIESGRVNNGRTGSSNRKSQFADLSNII